MKEFEQIKERTTKRYLFNQVDCILSLDRNRQNDYRNISELFETYNTILSSQTSKDFQNSMKDSKESFVVQCHGNNNVYARKMDSLEKNNPDSFLIVPMVSTNHCFCAVVRRTDEGISATLVNASKGGRRGDDRGNHVGYEEYIFQEKNVGKLLDAFASTSLFNSERDYQSSLTNSQIYELYEKVADKKHALNVVSRDQKDGNCFVKEPEKAIKYALATSKFNKIQFENLREFNRSPFKPKWTPCTEEIHRLYIEQLKKENPYRAEALQKRYDRYLEYKHYVRQEIDKKMPVTGRSMEYRDRIEFQNNNAEVIGVARYEKNGMLCYRDSQNRVVGFSSSEGIRTKYFDANLKSIGTSIKEGVGEKYYDNAGNLTGYTRSFFGMRDYSGDISREHKGKLPLDNMIDISNAKARTPLQERMLQRKLNEQQNKVAKAVLNPNFMQQRTASQGIDRVM